MTKYREENREHIAKMHKIIAKKWSGKQCDELTDAYVIHHIIQRTGLKRADVEHHPELIELVRQNKLLKRKLNESSRHTR